MPFRPADVPLQLGGSEPTLQTPPYRIHANVFPLPPDESNLVTIEYV